MALAQIFLKKANEGISMNLVVFRKPEIVYICDASEHGLGGYTSHGRAWRLIIPNKVLGRAHINTLEYIAQLISIWIDVLEGRVKHQDCILALGDNKSALGWMRRSNFRQEEDDDISWRVKQKISRKIASLILNSEIVLYKQWLKGAHNIVADSLSRDLFFMNEITHTKFLRCTINKQLPALFTIKPVPKEITSYVYSLLLMLPDQKQWLKPRKPSDLAVLNSGMLSSTALESMKSSLNTSKEIKGSQSCHVLRKQLERAPSLQEIKDNWWREQSQPPSHMWHRPSGQTTGKTQDWTWMERQRISLLNNSKDIRMKTVARENKKHYQCL